MKELDYDAFENEIKELLKTKGNMSFATSYKDRVTVRTVYYITIDLKLYFLTRKSSTKFKQLLKNNKVAVSKENMQLEGIGHILGHPSEEKNREVVQYCLDHGYDDFKRHMKYKNTVLIEVEPKEIVLWKNYGREHLDICKRNAYRIG